MFLYSRITQNRHLIDSQVPYASRDFLFLCLFFYRETAVSSAISIISVKEVWRSSAEVDSPVTI